MTESLWVELSQENLRLARAELGGAAAALDTVVSPEEPLLDGMAPVPGSRGTAVALAGRLALARRCLAELPLRDLDAARAWFGREGAQGGRARFRPLHGARADVVEPWVHALARAFVEGGGTIDLERPTRRFWYVPARSDLRLFEEVATIDRRAFESRRMPRFPFQRPVSLPPRLSRAAANLARVRPGDRVVDPFCGTGALLLEAALLGARCSGVDRDAEMVRGALRNFGHAGESAASVTVGDAAAAFPPPGGGAWDAILTDPPYGRQSGAGGEDPAALVARCLPEWTRFVRRGGLAVVIVPGGPPSLVEGWVERDRIPDRVHRSLTREFRVYERTG